MESADFVPLKSGHILLDNFNGCIAPKKTLQPFLIIP